LVLVRSWADGVNHYWYFSYVHSVGSEGGLGWWFFVLGVLVVVVCVGLVVFVVFRRRRRCSVQVEASV
jgi:hypothetical protein